MAKSIACVDSGLILDTTQAALATADGAVYDAIKKKWDLSKRMSK
jgi:hypothetical protein